MMSSESRLSISHARAGARRVLVVEGTIDLDGAPRLAQVLDRAGRCPEPVAIDLCDAEAEDAAGAALLVNCVRRLHRRRADVAIVCPPGRIRAALERTGLGRRVEIIDDRDGLAAPPPVPVPGAHAAARPARAARPRAGLPRAQRAATPERRGALLAEATLAIEARYGEPDLALGDVARQIATSERQLQRVFAELAGSSFRDELAAVRMQHAARMLQGTVLAVGDIGRLVGYRQPAQFAKAFRRHHGVSPSAFRRAPG
jgi:AraC family transcriptional regulator, regulatory protein of adaptative response / methylphosphotriester-DNA alkyltransferase methyltransferase